MKYADFQDIKIPRIALGTWSWGTGINGGNSIFGNNCQEPDLRPVYKKAVEYGFNLWDTAAVYGMGSSERILGKLIKDDKNILVSTKYTPMGIFDPPMEKVLNNSCNHLGRDTIDIYWIHSANNVKKWTTQLASLLKNGKIKYAGVSNHNLAQVKQAKSILEAEGLKLSCVQNHYSLLFRVSERNGIIDWCKENNVTFFAYMVLEQGALTGKYSSENPFKSGSRRAGAFTPNVFKQIEGLKSVLGEIADKYSVDQAQIATAWAISKGVVPIIGVTKEHHVDAVNASLNIQLEKDEILELEKAATATGVEIKGFWEDKQK